MSYGAALPAGAYAGALGAYHPRREAPSNQGAAMRYRARQQAVSLGGRAAGLGGLGEGANLCTDAEWSFTRALVGGAADMLGGALAPTTSTDKFGETTTSGGGAGYYAAAGAGTLTDAWGATCEAEARQQQLAASEANTLALQEQMEQQRRYNEQLIAAQRSSDQQFAMMMMQAQQSGGASPSPVAASGIDQNTLLIGGGILAAIVVGALILK